MKSKFIKELQFLKISFKFWASTEETLKLFIFNNNNELQFENKFFISFTWEVLNDSKSNDNNEIQFENI